MSDNNYHVKAFYNQIMKQIPMLYGYQFILEFINTGDPAGGLFNVGTDPADKFAYYAQSATLPKVGIVKAKATYYGTEFRTPTVVQYDHEYTVKILLEQDMIMYKRLCDWVKLISDLKNNGGGRKVIPDMKLRLNLLDSSHQVFTTSYVMEGVWPNKIDDISLKYAASDTTPVTVTAHFKYQYCYRDDNLDTNGDPLSALNHKIR